MAPEKVRWVPLWDEEVPKNASGNINKGDIEKNKNYEGTKVGLFKIQFDLKPALFSLTFPIRGGSCDFSRQAGFLF